MAVKSYAHVDKDGNILNVSLWDKEVADAGDPRHQWSPPEGCEAICCDGDSEAESGGTYDKATKTFHRAPVIPPSRQQVLTNAPKELPELDAGGEPVLDADGSVKMVPRPADELAAEKAELLAILEAKLQVEDVTNEELNLLMRLRLP